MTEKAAGSKKVKPSKEELKKVIDEKGYKYAGEKYGVADNTVRRWLMAYGVALEPKCELKARTRQPYEKVGDAFVYEKHLNGVKNKKPRKKREAKVKSESTSSVKSSTPDVRAEVQVAAPVVAVQAPAKAPVRHEVVDLSKIKNRYSPAELAEFRVLVEAKITEAFEAMCILKEGLTKSSENGTDDTISSGNVFEEGTASIERENMTELVAKKQKHLNALQGALSRIGNGTYGICMVTGKLIPKARLLAVPHATKCVEAKTDSDNGKVVTPVTVDADDVQE